MDEGQFGRARTELGLALAIAEKHGMERWLANSQCDLAFAELGDGRIDEAALLFGEALAAAARMGWTENVAFCLVGCTAIAAAAGELDHAGHLLGQAEGLCEDIHLMLEAYAEAVRARVEGELRFRLGEDRLQALRTEGRSLSMEDAVSDALAAVDSTR
jgi:hypothetical protein